MSPARSKRTPIPHRRSRADIVKAVGVASAIVLVTALLVWLMRPGPVGTLGTGGLVNRQPRASWLVGAAIGLALVAIWWILFVSRRARGHAKVVLPIALGVVVVAAIIGGFAWPGGVLRHDVAPPPNVTPATTPATTATTTPITVGTAPTTGATGATGPSGSTVTSVPSSSVAPTTTTKTTTASTGSPTTKSP